MARPGITYQEVAAAANSIIAAEDTPTIAKIRAKLGTGSPNTIHRHLTAWRAAAPVKERKAPELPAELQVALVQEFKHQASEARAELENELGKTQAEAAELAETGERLEKEMAELTERNQTLSDESQRLKALADERAKEMERLQAELARERKTAEEIRIQKAVCETKLELSDQRIDELKLELTRKETELTQAQAEAAELRGKLEAFRPKSQIPEGAGR